MALIDLLNYDNDLYPSSQGRAGTPDGNFFFDTTNGTVEFFGVAELATYIVTDVTHPAYTDGTTPQDNPLIEADGLKFEAIYAVENRERRKNETLRKFDRWTSGTFKFGGAYNYINSKKPATAADREIIRGSGWNEFASDGGVDRIYFGNKGLSGILPGSQPYYQLIPDGTSVDFAKVGQIDEAVQVFGDTGNVPSDAGAGDFDSRTYEAVSIRTYGQNYDRKETTNDLGITELGGYSTGFALNESIHLTTSEASFPLADVYGGSQVAPWTGMGLEELDVPQVEGGFNEVDGNFTWVLNNTLNGTLNEMVAFLDAIALQIVDINDHATNSDIGKDIGVFYSYDAQGRILTDAPFAGEGLFLENVPTADQQSVVFTDDAGGTKTYPFQVSVEAEVGATAKADVLSWYHSYFASLYNTAGALTVEDSAAAEVKGLSSTADGNNKIIFGFDYTGDTIGGPADTDKNCVFLCEGDGGATQAKTLYTITKITTVAFACIPGVENNA